MQLLYHTDKNARMVLNNNWKIINFNMTIQRAFETLYNDKLKKGTNIRTYIDYPLISFFEDNFHTALEGEEIQSKKKIQIEGKDYWFQFSLFPLINGKNHKVQILFTSENVSAIYVRDMKFSHLEKDQNHRDKFLKKSEDKWRSLVESSPNIILTLDIDFNITYMNRPVQGFKLAELIGSNFLQYFKSSEMTVTTKYLTDCIQKGLIREFVTSTKNNANIVTSYSTRIAPIRSHSTNLIESIIIIASEITDPKRFESEKIKSDEKFKTMADNAPVMIWISDIEGECFFFNRPWLSFTGKQLEEEIGNGWTNGIFPEDSKKCLDTYHDFFLRRQNFEMEYRLKRHDGEYRWILDRGKPLFNPVNEFTGFIGSCIDITEIKKRETETRESLEEKEILLKEIHHRVKNNLQIISSLLSLQSNRLQEEALIQIFQSNINRIKSIAILHDMIDVSKNPTRVNFKDYLRLITNYLLMIYDKNRIKAKIQLDTEDLIISIDFAIYFGLIINELISNSLQYAFPDNTVGIIDIEAKYQSEDLVLLIVRDNGVGFPKEISMEGIQSFGLNLVQMLTKQMQGTVSLENKSGSQFKILLPTNQIKHRGK